MSVKFKDLPYALDALEPYVSRSTLEFHYGKHHKGYVTKLNKLLEKTPYDELDLEGIILDSHGKFGREKSIYNNAAQVWNHEFYWECLTPRPSKPSSFLISQIQSAFGSLEALKTKFIDSASNFFGSGWAWLSKDEDGTLSLECLSNALNPLTDDKKPLLTIDLWEHAYYLDYQNERKKYLENVWKIINWDFVEKNAASSLKFERDPRSQKGYNIEPYDIY